MNRRELQNSIEEFDQRVFIKFGVLLGHNATAIHKDLRKSLDHRAFTKRNVQKWVKQIKEGRTDIEEGRGGAHRIHHESEARVEIVKKYLDDNRGWSLSMLAEKTGIPKTTLYEIMTVKLKLKKIMCKWVLHLLPNDQIYFHIGVSEHNLRWFRRNKSLLKHTLAIDES